MSKSTWGMPRTPSFGKKNDVLKSALVLLQSETCHLQDKRSPLWNSLDGKS